MSLASATIAVITSLQVSITTVAVSTTSSSSSTTTTISQTSTVPPPPATSSHNISGAAIAGAVVGPICGVALLLGLAFLFLRRRRTSPTIAEASTEASTYVKPLNPDLGGATFGGYSESKPGPDLNTTHTIRPIPPAYPGPNIAMNTMPTHTNETGIPPQPVIGAQQQAASYEMPTHTNDSGIPPQPVVGAQQQTGSYEMPTRRPVTAELGTNPRVL